MDKEDDSDDFDAVSATKTGVAIEGMQMLTRHHRNLSRDYVQEDNVSRDKEKDVQDIENEEAAQLMKNMNAAMAKLNLLSLDGDRDTEDDNEVDDVAIDREGSPNPYSDDEGGKDFLEEDLSVHDKDLTRVTITIPHRRYPQGFLPQLTPTSLTSPTTSGSFYGT